MLAAWGDDFRELIRVASTGASYRSRNLVVAV
jgi:hypothetical protein